MRYVHTDTKQKIISNITHKLAHLMKDINVCPYFLAPSIFPDTNKIACKA